jgi:hypothetical protein
VTANGRQRLLMLVRQESNVNQRSPFTTERSGSSSASTYEGGGQRQPLSRCVGIGGAVYISLLAVAEVEEEVRDLLTIENLVPKADLVASWVIARSGAFVVCLVGCGCGNQETCEPGTMRLGRRFPRRVIVYSSSMTRNRPELFGLHRVLQRSIGLWHNRERVTSGSVRTYGLIISGSGVRTLTGAAMPS